MTDEYLAAIYLILIFCGYLFIIYQENKMMNEWEQFKQDFFKGH